MTDRKIEAAPHLPAKVIEAPPASRPEPKLPGFEHRFATVEDVRLHYVIGGKPGGEVVVLVAGFPESWYAWRKVIPLLPMSTRSSPSISPGKATLTGPKTGTIPRRSLPQPTAITAVSVLICGALC